MTTTLTPDMIERLNTLLDQANGFVGNPEAFARRALELGIGFIPTARRMFLIDQAVHEGVLREKRHWQTIAEARAPLPMVLHCPRCGLQHVDAPDPAMDWTNPPHRSHRCAACELIWRPADVATVGVEKIATRGSIDNDPGSFGLPTPAMVEAGCRTAHTIEAIAGEPTAHEQIAAIWAAMRGASLEEETT